MGTLSVREDPHPTFRKPKSPDASSYRYCGWFTRAGSPPSFLPGYLPSETLRLLLSGSPPSEITPGLCVLLRNLHPPGRIRECCPPCGFLLSLFLFPKRAFYLLLDASNILSTYQKKQFFQPRIINNL